MIYGACSKIAAASSLRDAAGIGASRLLCHAGEALGKVSNEWIARAGVPDDCVILCGPHDSNAALLLAARGHSG